MRGYIRPLGFLIPYATQNEKLRRFNYPWNPYPASLSDPWEGSFQHTEILCPDGATLTNAYTIRLCDGVGNYVDFQFRSDGNPADAGKTLVVFAALNTANQVRDAFATAIGTTALELLAVAVTPATVTINALFKSSRANFTFQPGEGGHVAQQDALLFAPDPATYIPGEEGPLAVPARMGYQRMMPTRTISVGGQGEPDPGD